MPKCFAKVEGLTRPVISPLVAERLRQFCVKNHYSLNVATTVAVTEWLNRQESKEQIAS